MATIEERAKQMCYFMNGDLRLRDANIEKALIEIATDQDRLARQEERERCIKAAQDYYCNRTCAGYDIEHCLCRICDCRKNLRKAIEEGGNNEKDNVQ